MLINAVAPFAGAWIEMPSVFRGVLAAMSLPSRERGLKFSLPLFVNNGIRSLPSRERGLKSLKDITNKTIADVAPFAGAWIEIPWREQVCGVQVRRSLRGSVD